MPDLDLVSADGQVRVFELLHAAKPILLNLAEPGRVAVTPWPDQIQLIEASYTGPWELPILGAVSAPTAVLVRPDGYVAWAGNDTGVGLSDALTAWFWGLMPASGVVAFSVRARARGSTATGG